MGFGREVISLRCSAKPASRGLLLLGAFLFAVSAQAENCPALPDVLVQWRAETKRAEIMHVRPRSPAAKLGLRAENGLLSVNDTEVMAIVENPPNRHCAEGTLNPFSGALAADAATQRLHAALLAAQTAHTPQPQKLKVEMTDGRTRTLWVPRGSSAGGGGAPRAFASVRRENVLIVKLGVLSGATLEKTQKAFRRARTMDALFLDVREAQSAEDAAQWLHWLGEIAFPVATIVSPWTGRSVVQFAAQLRRETAAPIVGALPPDVTLDRPPIASWRNEYGTEAVFATARDALSIIKR